ncbi:hypothetical protein GCM10022251_76370 [Phytohabitans flavus]|uniref:Uncharacterized protein n=1 Tax=Phytohabitans flavus TaxID=1076124 RepID=A0A6F8XSV7_9ACTN|nr:hypothetical protein [Phytohabitans flavus]BCB76915.1 hypothetical protein Pflav_033250 [Phytohabitans flavus]
MDPAPPRHRLCDDLDALRGLAVEEGLAERLDELIGDARAGDDVGAALRELLSSLGIPAVKRPRSDPFAFPPMPSQWQGERLPTAEIYTCPLGVCGYAWLRRPGASVPECALKRTPLLLEEG